MTRLNRFKFFASAAGFLSLAAICLSASLPSGAASIAGLSVTSSSFNNGSVIPSRFTADGADVSPQLNWSKGPASTKSYAIVCMDPDAPKGTWYHWLIWNIPVSTTSLSENAPKGSTMSGGASQGTNDFNKLGYNGPSPPPGRPHRYYFRVMALDTNLALRPGAGKGEVLSALQSHVVGAGDLLGTYKR